MVGARAAPSARCLWQRADSGALARPRGHPTRMKRGTRGGDRRLQVHRGSAPAASVTGPVPACAAPRPPASRHSGPPPRTILGTSWERGAKPGKGVRPGRALPAEARLLDVPGLARPATAAANRPAGWGWAPARSVRVRPAAPRRGPPAGPRQSAPLIASARRRPGLEKPGPLTRTSQPRGPAGWARTAFRAQGRARPGSPASQWPRGLVTVTRMVSP